MDHESSETPRNVAQWLRRADEAPDFALVGVPTSNASPGDSQAWRTPAALRSAFHRFSTFDAERARDLAELSSADKGDWLVSHLDPTEASEVIEGAASRITPGATHVFVGGDGIITAPIVAGLPHAPLERTGLICLDAHHGVQPPTAEGAPHHDGAVRVLVERGLPGDHVVQIGINPFGSTGADRAFIDGAGVRVASMGMIDDHGIDRIISEALAYLTPSCDAIVVSVDLAVLDRSFAPAAPGAMPGGFTPRQLTNALRMLGDHPTVIAADFVEVDPAEDVGRATVMNLAATLLAFAAGVHGRRTGPN